MARLGRGRSAVVEEENMVEQETPAEEVVAGDEHEQEATETTETAEAEKPKGRQPWTEEQKAAQAERMKAYWAEHEHPLKGTQLSEDRKNAQREAMVAKRQGEPLAECDKCAGPIYNEAFAPYRLGEECLRKAVADGSVRIEDGQRVDLAPLNLVGKALKRKTDAEKAAAKAASAPAEATTEESAE
jgi:hypothetical protein